MRLPDEWIDMIMSQIKTSGSWSEFNQNHLNWELLRQFGHNTKFWSESDLPPEPEVNDFPITP